MKVPSNNQGPLPYSFSLTKPLFVPWISRRIVSAELPESGTILRHEFQCVHPLRSLPCVATGGEDAHRASMFARKRRAVKCVGEDDIFIHHHVEGVVRGISSVRVLHHETGGRFHAQRFHQILEENSRPVI